MSEQERMEISDGLKFYLNHEVLIYDLTSLVEGVHDGMVALKIFLGFIGCIVMVLGFFLIIILFKSAVNENISELKIMRAIGFNYKQVSKVYLLESISVVFSAGILGMFLGLIISVTLTIEVAMLTEI